MNESTSTVTVPPLGAAPYEIVQGLLAHLRAGTTHQQPALMELAPATFTDPALAAAEIEGIFSSVPFIACHSSEVPAPHDFVSLRLPSNEAVIVRQSDGSVRAFVNMCRHRGSQLVSEESGSCRLFTCPYHGWSYALDGSLRHITFPSSFGEVDAAELGLTELPVEERHGLVWIIDRPGAAIDVAAWLGPETDAILAGYRLGELRCYRAATFEEPVNWKILHDAFLDGYHIKFAHPGTAGRVIHTNTYVVEDFGRHCRFASPRKSLDRWLEADPDPSEPMLGHVMITHFIGPNCTLLQLEDNFQVLTFSPVSGDPAESQMQMRLLVPPDDGTRAPGEWAGHWDKNWHILEVVLTGEDFPILRGVQRSYGNRAATSTLLGRNEVLNQVFHREVGRLRSAAQPPGV